MQSRSGRLCTNMHRSFTMQVKANLSPKPGGGKGARALDWWVGEDCPAELFAFVDLSTQRVWVLWKHELLSNAQQRSSGRLHLYMYSISVPNSLAYSRNGEHRFAEFLFENGVHLLFWPGLVANNVE